MFLLYCVSGPDKDISSRGLNDTNPGQIRQVTQTSVTIRPGLRRRRDCREGRQQGQKVQGKAALFLYSLAPTIL